MIQTPIDMAVFTELQDTMGEDFAAELVETFLDEAPSMIAELRSSVETQDGEKFRRAAHSIKSNANVFGAHILASLARDMELSGLESGTTDAMATLREANGQALSALRGLNDA